MSRVSSPKNAVMVVGRVSVENDSDLPTAYALAKQIGLTPLNAQGSLAVLVRAMGEAGAGSTAGADATR